MNWNEKPQTAYYEIYSKIGGYNNKKSTFCRFFALVMRKSIFRK